MEAQCMSFVVSVQLGLQVEGAVWIPRPCNYVLGIMRPLYDLSTLELYNNY
jgi:hypothetical protein